MNGPGILQLQTCDVENKTPFEVNKVNKQKNKQITTRNKEIRLSVTVKAKKMLILNCSFFCCVINVSIELRTFERHKTKRVRLFNSKSFLAQL